MFKDRGICLSDPFAAVSDYVNYQKAHKRRKKMSAKMLKEHVDNLSELLLHTWTLLEALENDCDICISKLWVDGGMTRNKLLMQMLADLCGLNIVCPSMPEMTALGAAMAAGSAEGIGVWDLDDLTPITTEMYLPSMTDQERDSKFRWWKVAVQKANSWSCEQPQAEDHVTQILKSTPAGLFTLASIGILILAELVRAR
ncbi:Glycerol kinase [Lamellibrachia satsuma]|nr:Glycerol kinase [Lamellibrachia satsuma]